MASEGTLAEARAVRERLHKKRKKESRKLQQKHALEMEVQAGLFALSMADDGSQPPQATAAAPSTADAAASPAGSPAAVALSLAELEAATGGFGEEKLIGSGGFGRVYTAETPPSLPPENLPARLRHLPVAVKRAKAGAHDLADLRREATDALLYLHTPVPGGKGAVVHRDFKPENILLDDELNAYLADTGFAKMDAGPDATSKRKSASSALYLTRGYLDPSVIEGGEYSALTDGWALGITILVALTGRSALSIINKCEEECDEDFTDIDAQRLVDVTAGWPAHVATAIKELVRSANQKCLCHPSNRKKLALPATLETLTQLCECDEAGGGAGGSSSGNVLEGSAASAANSVQSSAGPGPGYKPTPLSMQVHEMRKGGDAQKRIKDNMLLVFSELMPRLDAVYAARAAMAPQKFEERIDYWHFECGMRADLKDRLHRLRIWANAARHHDDERWRRDGPRDGDEALRLVSAAREAIEALER